MSGGRVPGPARENEETRRRLHRRQFSSEGSAQSSSDKALGTGLVYNKTFIDICEDHDSSLSPRASSDPGSEPSSSFWEIERDYVESLSDKWAQVHRLGPIDTQGASSADAQNLQSIAQEQIDVASSSQGSHSHGSSSGKKLSSLSKRELWNHMSVKTTNITRDLRWKGHHKALTVIEELPEQVGDALLETATKMVDKVHSEVAVMQTIIQNDEQQALAAPQDAKEALQNLQSIPDMIMEQFEASVVKAKGIVRSHVDGVKENISGLPMEQAASELRKIPIQVQQIAGEAVQVAVEESHEQAKQKLDEALVNLNERPPALQSAKMRMLDKIPAVKPVTENVASDLVVDKVEQAVMVVKESEAAESTIANRVVADTLLRAKAGQNVSESVVVPHVFHQVNPGSIGHPELCPRPCLYFAAGKCSNGMNCDFCHMSHDKRPAHLDKRHREMLKKMPFDECVTLALPLLLDKVTALGLGPQSVRMLEFLEAYATWEVSSGVGLPSTTGYPGSAPGLPHPGLIETSAISAERRAPPPPAPQKSNAFSKHSRALLVAMRNMSIRALLTTLHRAAALQAPSACPDIYDLIQQLREQSSLFQDDLARQLRDIQPADALQAQGSLSSLDLSP